MNSAKIRIPLFWVFPTLKLNQNSANYIGGPDDTFRTLEMAWNLVDQRHATVARWISRTLGFSKVSRTKKNMVKLENLQGSQMVPLTCSIYKVLG